LWVEKSGKKPSENLKHPEKPWNLRMESTSRKVLHAFNFCPTHVNAAIVLYSSLIRPNGSKQTNFKQTIYTLNVIVVCLAFNYLKAITKMWQTVCNATLKMQIKVEVFTKQCDRVFSSERRGQIFGHKISDRSSCYKLLRLRHVSKHVLQHMRHLYTSNRKLCNCATYATVWYHGVKDPEFQCFVHFRYGRGCNKTNSGGNTWLYHSFRVRILL
jgi:hypothetical protein